MLLCRTSGAKPRRLLSAVIMSSSWRRRVSNASRTRAASSGSVRGSGRTRSANCARIRASMRSVFARCPVARAKSRTWRGFTTATGNGAAASAAAAASSSRPWLPGLPVHSCNAAMRIRDWQFQLACSRTTGRSLAHRHSRPAAPLRHQYRRTLEHHSWRCRFVGCVTGCRSILRMRA